MHTKNITDENLACNFNSFFQKVLKTEKSIKINEVINTFMIQEKKLLLAQYFFFQLSNFFGN